MHKQHFIWISIILIAVIALPPFIVPIFSPWSEINCRHEEINIKTGQARYSRYIWFICVSERVEETFISKLLNGERVEKGDIEEWQKVNTRSLFGPSPHYRFHAAYFQIGQLETLSSMKKMIDGEGFKKEDAVIWLNKWQTSGDDFGLTKTLTALGEQIIPD